MYCRSKLQYFFKAHTECYLNLSSGDETIAVSFKIKIIHGRLPSSPIFSQCVLKEICLEILADGIVSINKRVTYITNEVLTSKHDCVFEVYSVIWTSLNDYPAVSCTPNGVLHILTNIILSTNSIVQRNLTDFW